MITITPWTPPFIYIYIYIYIYMYIYIYIYIYQAMGLMSRVFTNGPGDQDLIPGRVIPKTQKMVLDAALLNTQHYKVRIKGKVEQSKERSSTPTHTYLGVVAIEKGAFGFPLTIVANFTYIYIYIYIYIYVSSNSKDKFCLYKLFKILLSFLISVLVSGWNWGMNLPKLSQALSDPS